MEKNPLTIDFLSTLSIMEFADNYKDLAIKGKVFYEIVKFIDKFEELKKEIYTKNKKENFENIIIDVYSDYILMNTATAALNKILRDLNLEEIEIVYNINLKIGDETDVINPFKNFNKKKKDTFKESILSFQKKLLDEFIINFDHNDDEHIILLQISVYYDIQKNYYKLLMERQNEDEASTLNQKYVEEVIKLLKKLLDMEKTIIAEVMNTKNIKEPNIIEKIYKLVLAKYFSIRNKSEIDSYIKEHLKIIDLRIDSIIKNNLELIDVVNYIQRKII